MQEDSEYKQFLNAQEESFSFLEYLHPEKVPHLHFVHATGFNAYTYRQLLELLSQKLSVHAMDLRGHGHTKAPADPEQFTSWQTYYQDLTQFLEQRPQPLFLAGHSLGSAVSTAIAATRPDLVKGVILIEPFFPKGFKGFGIRTLQFLGMGQQIPIAKKALRRRAHFPSMEEAKSYYVGRSIFKSWQESWIEDYLKGGTNQNSDGCLSLTCTPAWESKSFSLTTANSWKNVTKLQCPILLICGGTNSTLKTSDIAEIKKIHPSASVVHKQEASHFFPMEYPEEVAGLITRFCESQT